MNRFLAGEGLNVGMLVVFSAVVGFAGSFISLLMSKPMAKWSTGAQVIDTPQSADEQWLVGTVRRLAEKAGIGMPEVAVYEGEPNAFATGAFRDSSLVAVSTGLLHSMTKEEVEAVLAHEVAHVANGDMVTLTLIQGVVNTFVVFLARIVGYVVDKAVFRTERGVGPGYYITVVVCEIVFGILASIIVAWFSRQREFRADAGARPVHGHAAAHGRPRCAGWAASSPASSRRPSSRRASRTSPASWRSSPRIRPSRSASPPSRRGVDRRTPLQEGGPSGSPSSWSLTVFAHTAFNGSRVTVSLLRAEPAVEPAHGRRPRFRSIRSCRCSCR